MIINKRYAKYVVFWKAFKGALRLAREVDEQLLYPGDTMKLSYEIDVYTVGCQRENRDPMFPAIFVEVKT